MSDTEMYSSLSEAESKRGSESDNDSLFNSESRAVSPIADMDETPRWRPSPPPQETWDDVDPDMEWGYKIVGEEVDYDGVSWYEVRWDDWTRPDGTKTTWHRADDKETEINPSQWIAEQSKKRQQLAQNNLGVELPTYHPPGSSSNIDKKWTLAQIPLASPVFAIHLLPTWYQSQALEEKSQLAKKQQMKKGGIPSRLVELAERREKRKRWAAQDQEMTEEERSEWLATLNGPSLGTFGSSQATTSMQSIGPPQPQSTLAGSSTQGAFSFYIEEDLKLTQSSSNINSSPATVYPARTRRQAIAEAEKSIMKTFKPHVLPPPIPPPPLSTTREAKNEITETPIPHMHAAPPKVPPPLPQPKPKPGPNSTPAPAHRVISNHVPHSKHPKPIPLPLPKPSSDPFSRTVIIHTRLPIKAEKTLVSFESLPVVKVSKPKSPKLVVEVVLPPLPAWALRLKQARPFSPVTLSCTSATSNYAPSTTPSSTSESGHSTISFSNFSVDRKGKGREKPQDTIRRLLSEKWSGIAARYGSAPISIKNDIDGDLLPLDDSKFTYLEERYMLDKGVYPTDLGFLASCSCIGKCRPATCSCHGLSVTPIFDRGKPAFAYTDEGLFAFNQRRGEEVVECNPLCSCPKECRNRVSQWPRDFPVEIFKTKKRGWGARSPVIIPKGKVLGLYTGLMIKREKAKEIPEEEDGYYFDLDHDEWDSATAHSILPEHEQFTVDSRVHGNWTRFINHSCSPNLAVYTVVRDVPPSTGKGFIAFYATTDIPAYTEFMVDYDPNSNHTLMLLRDKLYKTPASSKKKGRKSKKGGGGYAASRAEPPASASSTTQSPSVYHESWREFVEARRAVGELEASIMCGCDEELCRGYIYVHLKD